MTEFVIGFVAGIVTVALGFVVIVAWLIHGERADERHARMLRGCSCRHSRPDPYCALHGSYPRAVGGRHGSR